MISDLHGEELKVTKAPFDFFDAKGWEKRHAVPIYNPLDVVFKVYRHPATLIDQNGKRYIDLMSAYSATNLGHGHQRIKDVMKDAAEHLFVTSRAAYNEYLPDFLSRLAQATRLPKAIPMNTGAEAVETAIKAARRWGALKKNLKCPMIVVADGNFHGRTITVTGLSSNSDYTNHFGPYPSGFIKVPFGDIEYIKTLNPIHIAAVLIEPIQGEGGVIVPPPGYLASLQQWCYANKILLILDEVQSGLGRTGKMWAWEHEFESPPDGLIVGKSLGGGVYPVSAFCCTDEISECFEPGIHGSTFGGNPIAAAIGSEVLNIIGAEDILLKAQVRGNVIENVLSRRLWKGKNFKDVRGRGAWWGIELNCPARPLVDEILKAGVLTKDTHETVIRIAPPLNIDIDLLYKALDIVAKVVEGFNYEK